MIESYNLNNHDCFLFLQAKQSLHLHNKNEPSLDLIIIKISKNSLFFIILNIFNIYIYLYKEKYINMIII